MADDSKQSFLNTLFQWTVKNTTTENPTTTTSDVQPMTEDKKQWLNDALENLTVNPIERLKLCISKIKDPQTSDEHKKEFVDELCHWSEELDLAKDFFTLGGLEILAPLLDHTSDEIRIQTCSLLATLVQNNDHCQRIIVQSGLQQKLLKIVEDTPNPELKTKAVTAISALIRGYTLGQLQLQKYQGAKVLINTLSLPIPRLQVKICFLINTICSSSPHMKKIFYENGALEAFVQLFNSETYPDYENILQCILTLSSIKSDALITLSERNLTLIEEFRQKLNQRQQTNQNSEDHQEEISLINKIQQLFNSPSTPSTNASTTASTDKQLVLADS